MYPVVPMLPNFLFIGPDKSGSTWIFEALRQHPEVYVAPSKDIYFFDRYFERGIPWYESHFAGAAGRRIIGELSHDYLFSDKACERIRATIPDVKLLVNLRNPIERAFSEYLFLRKHGMVGEDFREATDRFPSILSGGQYARHLERYLARFPRQAILIQKFEKLKQAPLQFAAELYEFLGVDPSFEPSNKGRSALPAGRARAPALARMAKSSAIFLRNLGFGRAVGYLKSSSRINRLLFVSYSPHDMPRLAVDDELWLRNFYLPEVRALEGLLGDRFDAWLEEQ